MKPIGGDTTTGEVLEILLKCNDKIIEILEDFQNGDNYET